MDEKVKVSLQIEIPRLNRRVVNLPFIWLLQKVLVVMEKNKER
jgi:hypothetical protein